MCISNVYIETRGPHVPLGGRQVDRLFPPALLFRIRLKKRRGEIASLCFTETCLIPNGKRDGKFRPLPLKKKKRKFRVIIPNHLYQLTANYRERERERERERGRRSFKQLKINIKKKQYISIHFPPKKERKKKEFFFLVKAFPHCKHFLENLQFGTIWQTVELIQL